MFPGSMAMTKQKRSQNGRTEGGAAESSAAPSPGEFWRTVKRAARHVPFMEEIVAAYYCALDSRTPIRAKGIILAAIGYFVLPADAVPDFIFGVGFTDDAAVLTAAITAIRAHLTTAHRAAAREALAREE